MKFSVESTIFYREHKLRRHRYVHKTQSTQARTGSGNTRGACPLFHDLDFQIYRMGHVLALSMDGYLSWLRSLSKGNIFGAHLWFYPQFCVTVYFRVAI